MKVFKFAAMALLAVSAQVYALDSAQPAVSSDPQEIVTRSNADGSVIEMQQADGSFKPLTVEQVSDEMIQAANEDGPALFTPAVEASDNGTTATVQLAGWHGGGWHHGWHGGWGRMHWHRHWWHPHYHGWHGGWHYHHWHRRW